MAFDNTIVVFSLPNCDLCIKPVDACYDGKTIMGPWAYMCKGHFATHGIGLGPGKGQKLVLIGGKDVA